MQHLDHRQLSLAALTLGVLGLVAYLTGWLAPSDVVDAEKPVATAATSIIVVASSSTTVPPAPSMLAVTESDLVGDEPPRDACVLAAASIRVGDTGTDVGCLQRSLIGLGYLEGEPSGVFDDETHRAVTEVQTDRGLFVDGVVGRETALSLDIWRNESASVVRTPEPPDGAVDALGYRLSSVASTGPGAPPLPADSGTGRRLVYERAGQRVWAVADDESIIRSWLVSGSQYDNEVPGTHEVYSRSEMSTAWNGKAWLPMMVRWLKTDIGAIGFHALPLHVEDDTPYQTEAQLGTRLSGGCQRQAKLDAEFTWDFAQIGTKVVVI